MIREMAVASAGDPREWLVDTAGNLHAASSVYRAVFLDEMRDMLRREPGALFHDDFAEINQPCYFRDFATHAALHGLQFVAEADPATSGGLRRCDPHAQQKADYEEGRRFRQSLLCHADVKVSAEPSMRGLTDCFLGGPIRAPETLPDGSYSYTSGVGARFVTADASQRFLLDSAAVLWPDYLPLRSLASDMREHVLPLFGAGIIDLRTTPSPAADRIEARPVGSPLARLQARTGEPLTNLLQMEVPLEDARLRETLERADGKRPRARFDRDGLETLRQLGLLLRTH